MYRAPNRSLPDRAGHLVDSNFISQIIFKDMYWTICHISQSVRLPISFTAVYHRYTYVNQIDSLLQYIANNITTLDFMNLLLSRVYLPFLLYMYCNCNCSLTVTIIKIDWVELSWGFRLSVCPSISGIVSNGLKSTSNGLLNPHQSVSFTASITPLKQPYCISTTISSMPSDHRSNHLPLLIPLAMWHINYPSSNMVWISWICLKQV